MCSKSIAKCLLIAFNTIFFLIGAACLAVGILVLVDKTTLTSALSKIPFPGQSLDQALQYSSYLQGSAYVIIGVGAAIFIIGFCGCLGAIKEIKCLLIVYATIVTLILAAQIAAGVLVYLYKERVTTYFRTFLNNTIAEKYQGVSIVGGTFTTSDEPYSAAWDAAMIQLECCGSYNYTDFAQMATNWNRSYSFGGVSYTNVAVPITCCKVDNKATFWSDLSNFATHFNNASLCLNNADPLYTNTENCYDKLNWYISTYSTVILGVAIGVAALELLGVICACVLICNIGKDDV